MSRLRRGEPMDILQEDIEEAEDTEVIDRIFKAVKAFLPRDRKVAVLRGLNKRIANEIMVQEDRNQSLEPKSDDESERGTNTPRASMRGNLDRLLQQRGKQGKRTNEDVYHRDIPKPESPTKNDLYHSQNRVGIRNHSQPSYLEDSASLEKEASSSDGNYDDARTSRSAPRSIGGAAKQRKRILFSHMVRSTTLADPTVIQSISQDQTGKPASHLEIIRHRDECGRPVFKCPKCPQTKQWRGPVVEHMIRHGADGRFRCNDCDFATDNGASYHFHLKVHLEPYQRKHSKKNANGIKCPSPSEDETEISPGKMPISKNPGQPGIPSARQDRRDVAISLAERLLFAHPISRQPTSGIPQRRADTGGQSIAEFRCSECPEAFLFKSHLKLHRKHKHPNRNRAGRPGKLDFLLRNNGN